MSFVPAGAGAAAAAAAAAAKRRAEEEEERMTNYNSDELEGWEFKIVRSHTEHFRKRENVTRVCDEEARAGWELVEKFDNNRLRFKRRTDHRAKDRYLDFDPYRSHVGIAGGTLGMIIAGSIIALVGLILLGVFLATGEIGGGSDGTGVATIVAGIPAVAVVTLALGFALVRRRRR